MEPSSSHRGADAKERRLRRREVYLSRGVLPQQSIRRGLQLLMECKAPDGRYDAAYGTKRWGLVQYCKKHSFVYFIEIVVLAHKIEERL